MRVLIRLNRLDEFLVLPSDSWSEVPDPSSVGGLEGGVGVEEGFEGVDFPFFAPPFLLGVGDTDFAGLIFGVKFTNLQPKITNHLRIVSL